ncbi:MAG: DNA polymerase I [Actinomycetota bacterium]
MSRVQNKQKVLLLDGHSLAYRAFYALPPDLKTSSGTLTNAVYGFTGMLIKAIQTLGTRSIAAAFDKGLPAYRLAIRPEYKAQRTSAPDEFRQQIGLIHEVLGALNVKMFEVPGVEADDILAILARRLAATGAEVVVLTADRDFFQIVGPRITLMMNRRGISETVSYDVAAVKERYGFGPELYLDYAALRGDPSDNIDGVAGIGEKTAGKLIQTYGTLESVLANLDQLTPRIRTNLGEASSRLLVNKEFFRFRTTEELAAEGAVLPSLEVSASDLDMGAWDFANIRQLFDSLEFRILYDRLATGSPEALAVAAGFEGSTEQVTDRKALEELAHSLKAGDTVAIRVAGEEGAERHPPDLLSIATAEGARVIRLGGDGLPAALVWERLGPAIRRAKLATHGSKEALQRLAAVGVAPAEVSMDTELAAYLIDPARGSYKLGELARHYLDRELKLDVSGGAAVEDAGGQGRLLLEDAMVEDRATNFGLEAMAVAELVDVLTGELKIRGAWELLTELEIPLAGVLARLETTGIKLDSAYLDDMSITLAKQLSAAESRIFELAGAPFNINSPPQLRDVLYGKLGLKPSKKTKTGYSTDAAVLESLEQEHPIIQSILRHREISKLKSTYIDALPRLVDPATGRVHARFNQTVATTGRLSSDRPNLQNIPIRTEEGKQIRRAFIPEDGNHLLVADYSQIELRLLAHLSGDEELVGAFARGDDIHRLSIGKALGIPYDQVTPAQRSIGKMVSYGVTYGMGPFGLSQRLRIPLDQARAYIEGFFAAYPRIRIYLDDVVARAGADGFTTTMLGRRRYLPELQSRNPRTRGLGERQALNAPLQGSAADIMKLAMVRVDRALAGSACRMVLTVHDELVFEVPEAEVQGAAEIVREQMQSAIELDVPLTVDLAWGANWADAKA